MIKGAVDCILDKIEAEKKDRAFTKDEGLNRRQGKKNHLVLPESGGTEKLKEDAVQSGIDGRTLKGPTPSLVHE